MTVPFVPSDAVLLVSQAAAVALPAAGLPAWMERLRGRGWALIPPASIIAVIVAIQLVPDTADGLTYLALVATPPLAAAALGWAMHGSRPLLALIAAPLLALAWAAEGSLTGQLAALLITGLSCVTLGRLLAGVTPLGWLKLGIVAMAVADAYLVTSDLLQAPNAVLNAAAPVAHLPRLQFASFGSALIGYGDLFLAGVLGGVVAVEEQRRARDAPGRPAAGGADRASLRGPRARVTRVASRLGRQPKVALATLAIAALFDLLFFVLRELPATVPVALALGAAELLRRRRSPAARARAQRGR